MGGEGKPEFGGEAGTFLKQGGGGGVRRVGRNGCLPTGPRMAGEPGRQALHLLGRFGITVQIHEFLGPPDPWQGTGQASEGGRIGKDGEDGGGAGLGGEPGRFDDGGGAGGGVKTGEKSEDLAQPVGEGQGGGNFSVEG